MSRYSIGFLGCGQMGQAILSGLIKAGYDRRQIIISSLNHSKQTGEKFDVDYACAEVVIEQSKILILCIKPQQAEHLLKAWAPLLKADQHVIVSVLAGKSLDWIQKISQHEACVRTMPNLVCQMGQGLTLIYDNQEDHVQEIKSLFDLMGKTILLQKENDFHVGTALSSSGIAYVCTLIEALADGGVECGLNRQQALSMISQMVIGAGLLSLEKHPALLREQVASPGGVTIRGLRVLEQHHFRSALIEAVVEATQRSKELNQ